MTTQWQPHHEPLATTVMRNATIALVVGALVAWRSHNPAMWPVSTGLALWLTFGGHLLEVWYLNWLRPRLAPSRLGGVAARVIVWLVGGIALGVGVVWSMRLSRLTQWMRPSWWMFGVIFIGVELIAHAALALRRRPSFYDGAG